MITRPLLAGTVKDTSVLKYPVLVGPKIDGIRCLVINGEAVSRKFKPIPNDFVRRWIEDNLPNNIDGELVIIGKTFNEIQSAIMSHDGEPDFTFLAFDFVHDGATILSDPYQIRLQHLYRWYSHRLKLLGYESNADALENNCEFANRVSIVGCQLINNEEELLELEQKWLAKGFEGVMIRDPHGPYKCGRSTLREGYLLKLKRFMDAEARVIGFEERMMNENEQEIDELGYAKRSSKKEGLIPSNTMGSLIVEDEKTGVKFGIGSGFDDELRRNIWINRDKYYHKLVKYKYQEMGKEAPRFPVFLGFRHEDDT